MVKISVILVFIISSILFLGCSDVSEKKSVVENRWLGKDKVLDDFPYQSRYIKIYESHMHYIDTLGEKPIVLFVHGQPTWSYMWRKVIPHLEENFRVIAVDLIGYGLSGKPIIEYTPKDQISYLTRFIQNLDLKNVSLVMHDWGSYIGLGYAREKPNNIEALIFFESILPADNSIQLTGDQLAIQEGFEGFLNYFNRPGNAEKLTYEDNFFIEKYLLPTIDANEKQAYAYRLPFEKSESRKPLMQLLKHFPYKENPRSVLDEIDRQGNYLSNSSSVKLLITFNPGSLINQKHIAWFQENAEHGEIISGGVGKHFVSESAPKQLGKTINAWLVEQSINATYGNSTP